MKRPEKLISYRVYLDGTELIGTADVKLPSLDAITETVKGAGIAGEVESPTLGHFGPMGITINWVKITGDVSKLAKQKTHHLDMRGAGQQYDPSKGEYSVVGQKVVVRAIPKKVDLGKMEVGAKQDTSWEGEVVYMLLVVDGAPKIELDKFNYIYKVNDEDQMADIRAALAL
jgi:uncharacterized protein